MSISDANKQLYVIRDQLRQMEHQYRDGNKSNTILSMEVGKIDEARMFEEQETVSTLDHNSHSTGDLGALIEESNITFSNGFEQRESGFSTPIEFENHEQESHEPSVCGEFHQAIINMEDLNDVDILLEDVISSVQIDSMSDEDLHILKQYVSCPMNEESEQETLYQPSGKQYSATKALESEDEVDLRCKDRIRKDNHNIIERRRRYNINDRIQEISSLLPPSTPPSIKLSKGSILQAAVQCFKDLKKDKENLETLEAKQKTMDSKYQKMQLRTFRLELTTKLYELSEELDFIFVKNKSKPRMRHCEINDLVDELMKLGTPFKLKTDKCSTDSPFNEDAIQHVSHKEKTTKLQATKSILRDLIMKILSKKKQSRLVRKQEKAGQQEKIGRLKVQSRKHENEAAPQTRLEKHSMPDTISDELLTTDTFHLHSLSTNINYGECDILLDLFGSQSPHETAGQMETEPALPSNSSKPLFSTVTSPLPTTNMLEVLLKRSDKTPLQANSMESSLDSTL